MHLSTLSPVTEIGSLKKNLTKLESPTLENAQRGHLSLECASASKKTTIRGLSVTLLAIQGCDVHSAHEIGLANSRAGFSSSENSDALSTRTMLYEAFEKVPYPSAEYEFLYSHQLVSKSNGIGWLDSKLLDDPTMRNVHSDFVSNLTAYFAIEKIQIVRMNEMSILQSIVQERAHSLAPACGYQCTIGVVHNVSDLLCSYTPDRFALGKADFTSKWMVRDRPGFWTGSVNAITMSGTAGSAIFWDSNIHELKDDVKDECRQCNEVPCSCLPIFTGLPPGRAKPFALLVFEEQLEHSSLPSSFLNIVAPGNRLLLLNSTATEAIGIDDRTYGVVVCPWMSYEIEVNAYRDPHPEPKIYGID